MSAPSGLANGCERWGFRQRLDDVPSHSYHTGTVNLRVMVGLVRLIPGRSIPTIHARQRLLPTLGVRSKVCNFGLQICGFLFYRCIALDFKTAIRRDF